MLVKTSNKLDLPCFPINSWVKQVLSYRKFWGLCSKVVQQLHTPETADSFEFALVNIFLIHVFRFVWF